MMSNKWYGSLGLASNVKCSQKALASSSLACTSNALSPMVVTQDTHVFCENIGLCAVRLLVAPCLAYQEAIQFLLAAVEAVEQVLAAQFLDRAEFAHSRTLGVLRSFSRRGRDFDGASSAATRRAENPRVRGSIPSPLS